MSKPARFALTLLFFLLLIGAAIWLAWGVTDPPDRSEAPGTFEGVEDVEAIDRTTP